MTETRVCGHCQQPMRGHARSGSTWLCHPDDGPDCYRLVTVYLHPTPCVPCAGGQPTPPGGVRVQGSDTGEIR